jgi:hypothetical protein
VLEVNSSEDLDLYDLPDQAEHEVFLLPNDALRED